MLAWKMDVKPKMLMMMTRSGADVGMLYEARTFLNARSVPATQMSDVNACEELIFKYTDALLLTSYEELCKENTCDIQE